MGATQKGHTGWGLWESREKGRLLGGAGRARKSSLGFFARFPDWLQGLKVVRGLEKGME